MSPASGGAPFPSGYAAHGVKNGCLPEAFGFYDTFKSKHPEEATEVLLLELPDSQAMSFGHAVVVFNFQGRKFLWDHEAGSVEVQAPCTASADVVRAAVTRAYLAAIKRLKRGGRRTSCPPVQSGAQACATVARSLAGRSATEFLFRTPDGKVHPAVAFVGCGLVWVYCPEQGTTFARIRPSDSYAGLVRGALLAGFDRAEILPQPHAALLATLPQVRPVPTGG